jgi:hypothetical protein
MGFLRLAGQTAVMIVTGKVVSEGFDKAKKKITRLLELNQTDGTPSDNDAETRQVEQL